MGLHPLLETVPKTHPCILLVDDEPRVLRSLKASLKSKYTVFVANNGAEAKGILNKNKNIVVIVSDERMPVLLGHELLTWVCKHHPSCERILMTGYSDLDSLQKSINEAEIFQYISKPWNIHDFNDVLQKACLHSNKNKLVSDIQDKPKMNCSMVVLDNDISNYPIYKSLSHSLALPISFQDDAHKLLKSLESDPAIGVLFIDTDIGNELTVAITLEIHKIHPNLVIIIVTSAADGTSAIQLLNSGQVFKYLVKPLTVTRLKPMITAAVNKFTHKYHHNQAIVKHLEKNVATNKGNDSMDFWRKITSLWHKH